MIDDSDGVVAKKEKHRDDMSALYISPWFLHSNVDRIDRDDPTTFSPAGHNGVGWCYRLMQNDT